VTSVDHAVGVSVEEDVPMSTRDTITLVADVYRPDDGGDHPVLVVRTPYGDANPKRRHRPPEVDFFVPHGYTVVVQDTRGRARSEGTYFPWMYEDVDGFDTVEWAAALPGSSGVVGTTGQSYCGSVQYLMAPTRPPHLRAMCPVSGPTTFFQHRVYHRGVFELGWTLAYAIAMHRATMVRAGTYKARRDELDAWISDPRRPASALTDEAYRHVPVADWGDRLA
jgi:putative CocE/NonD family hydrolase